MKVSMCVYIDKLFIVIQALYKNIYAMDHLSRGLVDYLNFIRRTCVCVCGCRREYSVSMSTTKYCRIYFLLYHKPLRGSKQGDGKVAGCKKKPHRMWLLKHSVVKYKMSFFFFCFVLFFLTRRKLQLYNMRTIISRRAHTHD